MSKLAAAQARIRTWRENPLAFVVEELKAEPDPWQRELLAAFPDPAKQRIAMKACKGPGKTAGLAWCILNFLACYGEPGEHPKGAATSITGDNLDDNLWPELAKWRDRSAFLRAAFEINSDAMFAKDHPDTWFFSKRTWPKSANREQQANTLAGLHAKYLLFVIDESGGVPDAVMAAAEGGLATMQPGHFLKILQAGNPTHLEGPLYRACTSERHLWVVIEITGDPDDPNRSSRISIQWAREQIEKYGADNPWVLVNVFGKFPPASLNALLGPDDVAAAMRRHLTEDAYTWAAKVLGVDVARFGDDRTVIFPRQGLAAFRPIILRKQNTVQIAARVAQSIQAWGADMVFVDDSGHWGHGVYDNLSTAGYPVVPVLFEGQPRDPRYLNVRAEIHFELADWVKGGGALPPVPELTRELTGQTYTFKNGKLALPPKDQIKEILGVSPDLADAIALTFTLPVAGKPRDPVTGLPWPQQHGRSVPDDYDPYRHS